MTVTALSLVGALGIAGIVVMFASLWFLILMVAASIARDHQRERISDRAQELAAVTVLRPRTGNVVQFPCERRINNHDRGAA